MNEEETRAMLVECMRTRTYRREARNSLYGYINRTVLSNPGYVHGGHIQLMCNTIQSFIENNDRRGLIITMPPRHMKSTICSECLPAWYLSKDPANREVVIASYNQMQARKMARACRMRFDEPMHKEAFPDVTITVDNADEIMLGGKLNGRPSLIAAGIGAGLTGSGADLLIVDDPIKDMEEATSEVIRDKVYDWFLSVAMTRLSPQGKVLIVMTRWHHDDLVGRALQDNPEWEVLHMPAIDDRGDALWPERFPIPDLEEKRRTLGSRVFEALYQGRPTPDEGGFFRREWFKVIDRGFDGSAHRCRYWDKAATPGSGDWTTGVLLAEKDGQYCVEDVIHVQYGPKDIQATIRATAQQDGPNVRIRMEQEPGSSGVEVIDLYARQILRGYDFRADKVTGPKDLRAGPLSAALESGNVFIVRAQWNREYIQEFCEFPLGAHDDQVDATSGAFRELADTGEHRVFFF